MVNKLSKIVKSSKTGAKRKPTPVPVRIVHDTSKDCAIAGVPHGVDKWEVQEALRTLQRAAEIRGNKALMKAAKTEAGKQIKALSSVKQERP